MHQFFRRLPVLVLSLASFVAYAQDMGSAINKQDLPDPRSSIDQNPVSTGDVPMNGMSMTPGKTKISNANSVATDSSTSGKAALGIDATQQQMATNAGKMRRPSVDSEFQKFVQEATGKHLPMFGADLFDNAPSTFSPILNTPIPSEYPLGPGDEILIRGWGSIDIDFRATVDRNGYISIPTIGSILLAGVSSSNAQGVIQGAVDRLYKGVTLNVTFGRLRAITVYVVGQANQPGTYTISSLSTLVTALFASGGPNANGSMRHVQVKRAGKVVGELDLYAFIAKGDKSADIRLQDGDTIYIPPAIGYVALVGKVNTPAIYELRTAKDTIENLLDLTGRLPVVADPRRVFLERIDPARNRPRTVEEFALDAPGLSKVLRNGDLLNIISITPDFSNAVVLRGSVDQPIRAPFKSGMRISDLIPNRDYLITRASTRRQNSVFDYDADSNSSAFGSAHETNVNRNGKSGSNQNSDMGNDRGDRNNSNDINRQNRAFNDKDQTLASHIGDLIEEINWDYAVVERINHADLSVILIPFNLGNVFENPEGPDNIVLHPGDTVTVFSQQDVSVPLDKRQIFVRVEGEVNTPGVYKMTAGDDLQILLARAGGPTHNAYLYGTGFYREQVKKEQEVNMQKVVDRLESRVQSEQAKTAANLSSSVDAQTAEAQRQAGLTAAKDVIARMRRLQPTGRIAFGLDPEDRSFNKLPRLKLENGDRLVIPARPEFVHIYGAVNVESALLWHPDESVGKYIKNAGLTAEADTENIFILRADGSVIATDQGGWFSHGVDSVILMPGDSLVVPEKLDKQTSYTRFMMGLKDWTQILANFGIGVAAVHVLN